MADPQPGAYLKQHTAAAHAATEALLLGGGNELRRGELSLPRYQRLIETTATVWAAADRAFAGAGYYAEFTNMVSKLATAAQSDRALLGVANLDRPEIAFPPVNDRIAALGSLYVLLGSTLGGKIIARALVKCPELQTLPAHHFYEACAGLPPATWPAFQRELTRGVTQRSDLERCGKQALETFAVYQRAYPPAG